jgi:Phage integrase family
MTKHRSSSAKLVFFPSAAKLPEPLVLANVDLRDFPYSPLSGDDPSTEDEALDEGQSPSSTSQTSPGGWPSDAFDQWWSNRIPKRSPIVLINSRARPWTADGFKSSFPAAKQRAKIDKDLHFHDLRGTAATKFYIAGLSTRVIAEILAWGEDQVDRAAATKAIIRQLNEAKSRT